MVRSMVKDQTQFFKQHSDNPTFKKWVTGMSFSGTYVPQPEQR